MLQTLHTSTTMAHFPNETDDWRRGPYGRVSAPDVGGSARAQGRAAIGGASQEAGPRPCDGHHFCVAAVPRLTPTASSTRRASGPHLSRSRSVKRLSKHFWHPSHGQKKRQGIVSTRGKLVHGLLRSDHLVVVSASAVQRRHGTLLAVPAASPASVQGPSTDWLRVTILPCLRQPRACRNPQCWASRPGFESDGTSSAFTCSTRPVRSVSEAAVQEPPSMHRRRLRYRATLAEPRPIRNSSPMRLKTTCANAHDEHTALETGGAMRRSASSAARRAQGRPPSRSPRPRCGCAVARRTGKISRSNAFSETRTPPASWGRRPMCCTTSSGGPFVE